VSTSVAEVLGRSALEDEYSFLASPHLNGFLVTLAIVRDQPGLAVAARPAHRARQIHRNGRNTFSKPQQRANSRNMDGEYKRSFYQAIITATALEFSLSSTTSVSMSMSQAQYVLGTEHVFIVFHQNDSARLLLKLILQCSRTSSRSPRPFILVHYRTTAQSLPQWLHTCQNPHHIPFITA
jgi:hypothetical protein